MTIHRLGNFDAPDEVIELDLLRSELVHLGGLTISRTTHQPGWRWSTHVRPRIGGEWCQTRHVGICVSGRVHVVMADGAEFDLTPNAVAEIAPGHDAWVVGDVPYVDITWSGARTWLPSAEIEIQRVLTTVLFTDIVESTTVAESLGDRRWSDLIANHEERVRDTLASFNGREIRTTGDGVLALFPSTARAVRCAMSLHKVANDLGLRLRAAIHAGEVDLAGDDIRGVAVHEASRILGIAGSDQIVVSATVHDLLAGSDIDLVDLGEFELRGVPGRRRLYSVEDSEPALMR